MNAVTLMYSNSIMCNVTWASSYNLKKYVIKDNVGKCKKRIGV